MKNTGCLPTEEQKTRMIAEAAFYRSRKNESSGNPMDDWLAAEIEIEANLAAACGLTDNEADPSSYHRIRKEFRRVLGRAEHIFRAESLKKALTRAAGEVQQRQNRLPETFTRISDKVRREMAGSAERLGNAWNDLKGKPGRLSAEWRDKGTRALGRTSESVHAWLKNHHFKDRK